MNEHERLGDDPAFDRLMAADPARRAPDPVQGVLRAKVDALIAEQSEGEPAAREPEVREPAAREPVDDLAVRRHRRRTPWLVAAAVAGIVAAGGGGYLAGEQGLGAPAADMAVQSSGEADSSGETPTLLDAPSGVAPESQSESGDPGPLDTTGDPRAAKGFVFHPGAGLSDTPGTAPVRVAGTDSLGESLGSYPVVSEKEAVERLGDPRFAGTALGGSRSAGPSVGVGPSATPEPGGPIAWPVEDVTIVSATLTEMRYTTPDGTGLLVPAYELTDAEGNSWTVLAVDEELLDLTP